MEYTFLDGISKPASRLVYGTVSSVAEGREAEAFAALDLAWEAGFRVFDTANAYGRAEETMGKWIESRGVRDALILLDKGFNPVEKGSPDIYSADTIRAQIEESLRRLRTDYLDLYILHRDDPRYPVDEIVDVLNEYKDKGIIGRFGGSNWTMERTIEANRYAQEHGKIGFSVCSPGFNIAVLQRDPWGGSVSLTGKQNQPFREWLAKTRMPVFSYSSLGRGYVSGKFDPDSEKKIEECLPYGPIAEYDCPENRNLLRRLFAMANDKHCTVSQLALAWLLHQDMNIYPIVAPTGSHVRETIGAFEVQLSHEEISYLSCGNVLK